MTGNLRALLLTTIIAIYGVASAQTVSLQRGTPVKLSIDYPVSVSATKIGQQVHWKVAEDVMADGVPVILKGATALATVTTIFNVGTTPHRLAMRLEKVELAGGGSAPLTVSTDGYRILNFSTPASNDAVVTEGTEIAVFIAAPISVARSRAAQAAKARTTAAAPPSPSAPSVVLPDGTAVLLKLARKVSSATANVGDRVAFEVIEPVQIGEVTVIAKGMTAWGTITEAQESRTYGRRGKLGINIDFVRLGNGQQAALRATKESQGKGKAVDTWGLTAFSIPLGGVFAGAEEGNDVEIPAGKVITAYVNGDVPLAYRLESPVQISAVETPSPAVVATDAATTTVNVASTPPGADIEVDGKFVGNTPSSLMLAVGTHHIRVLKRGYRPWTRTLTTSGGTVELAAELSRGGANAK